MTNGVLIPQILTEKHGLADFSAKADDVLILAYIVCRQFNFSTFDKLPEICNSLFSFKKESFSFSCSSTAKSFHGCKIFRSSGIIFCKIVCRKATTNNKKGIS